MNYQKYECDIHPNAEMIPGGQPNDYYLCPECLKSGLESETVKHNKRMALLKNKLGEDVLDALIDLIKEIKYSR